MPDCVNDSFCKFVGWLIYAFPFGRIDVAHSNIAHAFPDMTRAERRKIAYQSCRRMVEMALFVLASPYLSAENLRSRIVIDGFVLDELKKLGSNPHPTVLMIPHFAMMETITMFPVLVSDKIPPTGVFYRPFDNKGLEDWVKSSRQRFGIELLSRKKGLLAAVKFLRENGIVAVLFDQKTYTGERTFLLDRVCTTSDLAGILAEKGGARCAAFWATRTGFWRSRIGGVFFDGKTKEEITFEGNEWLSEKLRTDEIARFDWLWLHRRWLVGDGRSNALGLDFSAESVKYALSRKGLSEVPRTTRILITVPDSFRETLALLPLVRQLRKSRADAFVSLLVQNKYATAVRLFGVADEVVSVPDREDGFFARCAAFRRLADRYADTHLVLADSPADDFQAYLAGANVRLAVERGRRRRFATAVYKPDAAHSAQHVILEYTDFMRRFGLRGEPDFSPLGAGAIEKNPNKIAVMCGGDGIHAWSVEKWCGLIRALSAKIPNAKFAIFGGESDSRTAFEMAKHAEFADVENFAETRGLAESVGEIASCAVAVGTDCAQTHIANALGLKTVAIYGATNPLRSGFVFDAPFAEIVPSGCPVQGGGSVLDNEIADVESAVLSFINEKEELL